jgi:HEAT repeat protein/Tfp pilus assembly protein PilF
MRNARHTKLIFILSVIIFLTASFSGLCWSESINTVITRLAGKSGMFGAADEVAKMDDPLLVEKLISALGHKEAQVRGIAAYALGVIGDKRAFEPLVNVLRNDTSFARAYAASALGYLGDARAVDYLINVTGGDHSVFAKDNTPSWATGALGKLGTKGAIDFLIRKLSAVDKDFRANAARALGESGDKRAVAPLIKAFQDKRISLNYDAEALGKIGGEEALQFLLQALKEQEEGSRKGAAGALGWTKDLRAVDPLIHLLINDKDQFVRSNSASALARIGDKRAVEPLIKALGDKEDYVRKSAATALGSLGDERAVEPLTAALKDPIDNVRKASGAALKKLNISEAEIKGEGLNVRNTLKVLVKELEKDDYICDSYSHGKRRTEAIELSHTINPPPAVPENARRSMVRGKAAFKMAGDPAGYNEAMDYYKKAVKLAPWWADPYFNLGLANEKLRSFDSAMDCLRLYLTAAPDAPDADAVKEKIFELEYLHERKEKAKNHALIARDLVQSEDYTSAVQEAKEAIRLDADHGSAHGWLGLAYVKQDMYKEAVVELTEALRLGTPDGLDVLRGACVLYTNLGWTYRQLGEIKKAINVLEEGNYSCVYGKDELKKFLNKYKNESGVK